MLNSLQEPEALTIHPWALATSNARSHSEQLRPVRIPDVPAAALAARGGVRGSLGMMSGDFVAVCGGEDQRGAWDAVATCFFIDTAHNVAEYIEVCASLGLHLSHEDRCKTRFKVTCFFIDTAHNVAEYIQVRFLLCLMLLHRCREQRDRIQQGARLDLSGIVILRAVQVARQDHTNRGTRLAVSVSCHT